MTTYKVYQEINGLPEALDDTLHTDLDDAISDMMYMYDDCNSKVTWMIIDHKGQMRYRIPAIA